jgi:DNA-binding MarR family transcriptional regulator
MSTETTINDYLAHLLAQANRKLNKQLGDKGVPLEQWRVLRVLAESESMTMKGLAETVSMNRPTMSKIVDKLVAEALVFRVPDSEDRRKIRISLSEKGKSLFVVHDERVNTHQVLIEHNYGISETKQLKEMLEDLLNKLS